MSTLLHMTVSPRGDASYSRRIGRELVARIGTARPDMRVIERDLARQPPPYPDSRFVEASLMPEDARGPAHVEALAFSEHLIGELEAADLVVIDTPMHNFTVPAPLKAWIDLVVRPRRTFRSTPAGKVGLLPDRPVLVVVACGGPFGDGPADQVDFLTPYLRYVLGTVGISTLHVLRLDNLLRGDTHVAHALERARTWIDMQAGQLGTRA
ncbi:NAD(P)H-dependent oxidoreductase [Archangium violaceum]|uniref:FMN-dependent NADH-azoreductase n=1 Tax=Archangium violaceum TaxID=83451 RepID=UPI00193C7B08|nr:NAD(P)H-dependent oxidoreductase [Archangium violaceum]QRK09682.1 NAD(P)H-dependent oxidoreductase [Archangium violaceum]